MGNIGKTVASNLVKGKRNVIVATHKFDDAHAFAKEQGSLAKASEVASAIAEADIVVMTVWFNTIQELFKEHATKLQGKIIIDPSNPIAPDGKGGFKKIIDGDESAGEILKLQLPKGAKLVKALGSLGATSLASAAHKEPGAVLFCASDDKDANSTIEQLIKDSGFEPVRIGGLEQSIRMEVFGALHEFGALGKPVTLAELEQSAQSVNV